MAEKLAATGTQLLVGGNVVPGLQSVEGPGGTTPTIDASAHDSTMQEFVVGLADGGEVSGTIEWDPASTVHQALMTAYSNRTRSGFSVKWPKADFPVTGSFQGSANFSGFVTQMRPSAPVNDMLTAAFTIKVTGAVQFF